MTTNIIEWLERDAQVYPDKTAFADDARTLSYQQLLELSQRIGTHIALQASKPGPVAILVPRGVDQPAAMMGAVQSGRPYAVLDSGSPVDRLQAIVQKLQPAAVVATQATLEAAQQLLPGSVIDIEQAAQTPADDTLLQRIRSQSSSSDMLYALFTSGSTGIPKGVMVTHANVVAYIAWFVQAFGIDADTVFGSQTPFYFSMSVSDVFATLQTGATMHIIPKSCFSFPATLVNFLNERQVNTIYWVPTALGLLARWDALSVMELPYLRQVLFAGEVMPTPALNYWMDHLPNASFANLFGPTETTDICTFYKVARRFADDEPLPIGRACEGCTLHIVRADGQPAAPGEEGELYVGGPFVAMGYLNDPDKTAAAFVPNPLDPSDPNSVYRTGDIVRLADDGELRFVCRRDAQIKRRGYRIELGEIEASAAACSGVDSCAAVFVASTQKVVLFYTGRKVQPDQLMEQLQGRLPKYMMPDELQRIKNMPVNRNGKIDRHALSELCASS